MHISRKIFLGGLLLLGSFPLKAQTNQTQGNQVYDYSLKQCIDYAMQHRDSVLNASLNEKIAQQKVRETAGMGYPQINGSFALQDYLIKPTSLLPASFLPPGSLPPGAVSGGYIPLKFGTQYQATAGVSGSQLIFDGSYLVGLKAAKTYRELASKATDLTKINVTASVMKAYYGALINERRLTALDANIASLQKSFDNTKAMNEQGFVEKLDVDRLNVSLTNLKVQRENIANLVQVTYYLLKFQMGMPMNAELHLTDSLTESFTAPVPEQADYKNRIEYSLLRTQRDLYALNLRRFKYGYAPTLMATGSLQAQAQRDKFSVFDVGPGNNWYPIAVVGATLSVPIFNGFQTDARIQQAKLTLMQNQNSMASLENAITFQVDQSSISYQNNYKTVQSQKQNMQLAEENARVTRVKYQQGVGSNLEVTTAENDLTQAQNNYYNSLYDLVISQIDLQLAKGTLKP